MFSGVPMLGAPEIRESFALGYGSLAAALLSVPLFLSLFVEAPLLLLTKRLGRRRMAVGGFIVFGLGSLLASASTSALQLTLALTVTGTAGGVALAVTQSSLMDADPSRREVWMTRWTLLGSIGDLAGPGVMALVAAIGFGWRAAFVVVSAWMLVAAVISARAPFPSSAMTDDDDDHVPIKEALRRAFANRRLLLWSLGTTLCDLLDEIVVIVSALFLHEVRGADASMMALGLAVLPACSALGLVVTERLLGRVGPLRLLATACVLCVVALVALVVVPGVWPAIALLGVVGFTSAPFYPIATAQAYRALPDDSPTVSAVAHLFSPLAVVLPLAVTAAGDTWGLGVCMLVLLAEPVGLFVLSISLKRESSS